MKVAVVDNSVDPSIYTPVVHWSRFLECRWKAFTAREFQFPDLDDAYTHLILTGSEASILDRDRWVHREVELALEAVERNIPVLGSCWGHQLLAIALGSPANVQRSECPEIGWISVDITEQDTLMGKKGQEFVFSSHFDEVVGLGNDFRVFASSKNCRVHAFQWRTSPVWGIQSHPEMNISDALSYLRKNVSTKRKSLSIYRRALDSTPKDTGIIHKVIKKFLGHC